MGNATGAGCASVSLISEARRNVAVHAVSPEEELLLTAETPFASFKLMFPKKLESSHLIVRRTVWIGRPTLVGKWNPADINLESLMIRAVKPVAGTTTQSV